MDRGVKAKRVFKCYSMQKNKCQGVEGSQCY